MRSAAARPAASARASGISTRTSSSSSSTASCGCPTSAPPRSARSPIVPIRSVSPSASASTRSAVTRDYPLTTSCRGPHAPIGVLHVEATLTDVYQQLLNRALVILASQAAKTFLVSLFIIYMFHLLVTRHLVAIAEFVSKYSLARPPPPLRLERRPPRDPDELDKVIDAFNAMCANLERAYGELREANANLERDLNIRRRAEEDARASEQRFRDYAETASDWFWETGPDHVFTYISDRPAPSAWIATALIGKRRLDAASDRDAEPEKWREHMATLERHEPFRNFEYRGRDVAGRHAPFQRQRPAGLRRRRTLHGLSRLGHRPDRRSTRPRSGCANPRRWMRSGSSPAASPTTSTTCSPSSPARSRSFRKGLPTSPSSPRSPSSSTMRPRAAPRSPRSS